MMKSKGVSLGLAVLVLLLVLLLPGVDPGSGTRDGCAIAGDWSNISILYTTDIKGKIEPCG